LIDVAVSIDTNNQLFCYI